MLVYMFYALPFYGLAAYALIFPGCSWLPDWALVFAGAIGQVRRGWGVGGQVHKKESFCPPINFFCALPGQGDAGPLRGPSPSSAPQDSLVWGRKSQTQTIPNPMGSDLTRGRRRG